MVGMQYIHTYTTLPPKIVRVSCSPTSVHEAKITITTFLIAHRKGGGSWWGKERGRDQALVEAFQIEESLTKVNNQQSYVQL